MPDCLYTQYYTIHIKDDATGGYGNKNLEMQNYKYINLVNDTTDPLRSMYISILQNDLSLEG